MKILLTVRRSWRERWFTLPWHPFTYTRKEEFDVVPPVTLMRRVHAAPPLPPRRHSWQPPARPAEETRVMLPPLMEVFRDSD